MKRHMGLRKYFRQHKNHTKSISLEVIRVVSTVIEFLIKVYEKEFYTLI